MIIRKIKPEELKRTKELFATAFEFTYDNEDDAMKVYEDCIGNPKSREDEDPLNKYAAFEDDDKTMTSCIYLTSYEMNFDGARKKMAGVGGVSSLPQYRRHGGIRKCFEALLPDIYKEGVDFAYLYPFSSVYYRKFGFEMGCFGKQCNYLLSMIPKFDLQGGYCVMVDESNREEVFADIQALYEIWEKKYNGMIHNETHEYAFATKANPYKDQKFTYIYYRSDKTPLAYFTIHKEKRDEGQIVICDRLVYLGKEGMQGFLTLVKSMASDHVRVLYTIPACETMEFLVKEWSLGVYAESLIPLGMVRVVNVAHALKDAKYIGSGRFVIGMSDAQIADNNGNFEVVFENGKAVSVTKVADDVTPQIRMDIPAFSHGIFRGFRQGEVSDYDGIEILDEDIVSDRLIDQIFYPKNNFLMEYF